MPDDRVSRVEAMLDKTAQKFAERSKKLFRDKYSRPVGSKPVSRPELQAEWHLMKANEGFGGEEQAVMMMKQLGLSPESALSFLEEMQKPLKETAPSVTPAPDTPTGY